MGVVIIGDYHIAGDKAQNFREVLSVALKMTKDK